MSQKIYTGEEFKSFKEQILSKHIARKKVSLGEINIVAEGIATYAGLTFKLDKPAFASLLRVLGISQGLRTKMIKDFGNNFVDKMIELMSARTKGNKSELVMLVDIQHTTILNFIQSDRAMLTNATYLEEVEKVIGASNLQITDMNIRDNGSFSVSTIAENSEWGLQGLKDEVFKFGMNFENDPVKGSRMSPFNQRLVCTNGMTTTNMMGHTKLINTKDSWEHFFHTVNSLEKQGFKPAEFASSVKDSMHIQASVAELEGARNMIKSNSAMEDSVLEGYLPYAETVRAYAAEKQDLSFFSKDQKKNAVSATTYWDLINDITYIASNVTGMGIENPDRLQMYAGQLLSKTPDTSNLVRSPFDRKN